MTSQTSDGIDQLLAAEKRAAEKVRAAKLRKAKKLKQAKDEAQAEIADYRAEREKLFKDFMALHQGSQSTVSAKIDADTRVRLNEMNRGLANNKERVIGDVLKYIYEIAPALHPNYEHTLYRSGQLKSGKQLGNGHILKQPDDNEETDEEEEIDESDHHRPQCCAM